ncbi:MAG: TetR/AcrR family transcriptional regulator [Clostridia bacterium]|nr:TetR/AcrR family transcriptional regulator [Clostridia bacterium]
MGKLENNKQQKLTSLLNTAFNLFTTQGVAKTSIAEISQKAGIAKGTFYLYFKDKYDIRNRLISHESSKLFKNAVASLEDYCKKNDKEIDFEGKIIFIINHIIDELNENQTLLTFISKNLSWGIFKEALTTKVASDDINFKDVYYEMINDEDISLEEPEIMLFLIVELVSSTCYSSILYKEPADINKIKPYLFKTVRAIIKEHTLPQDSI